MRKALEKLLAKWRALNDERSKYIEIKHEKKGLLFKRYVHGADERERAEKRIEEIDQEQRELLGVALWDRMTIDKDVALIEKVFDALTNKKVRKKQK